jgi:hypothetical protein
MPGIKLVTVCSVMLLACKSKPSEPAQGSAASAPTVVVADAAAVGPSIDAAPATPPAAAPIELTDEQLDRVWRREDAVFDQDKNVLLYIGYDVTEDTEVVAIAPAAPANAGDDQPDATVATLARGELATALGARATKPVLVTGIPTKLATDPRSGAVKGPAKTELPAIAGSLAFKKDTLTLTVGGKKHEQKLDGGGVTTPVPKTIFIAPDKQTVWVLVAYEGDSFTSYQPTVFQL